MEALKQAIDANDLAAVQRLMTADPALHRAPLGYGKDGPLTWAAECRVPFEAPSPERLAIVKWMILNGSDVHQGGDGPLMRASLNADRIPMMQLLVEHGADVNASWHGHYPILFGPCECLNPESLLWLLEHGADPNCSRWSLGTALDYLHGAYIRDPEMMCTMHTILRRFGGTTRYDLPGVEAVFLGQTGKLQALLDADPALVHRHYPELDFGTTAARLLTLIDATLLHVAAEFGQLEIAKLLLDRGANPNEKGHWGQTPIFHAASQNDDFGLPVLQLLVERGAELNVRSTLPGHYESPGETVDCTPLAYARLFPGGDSETVRFLAGAVG